MSELDPLLLSRIQFAFTISFHIIFPSFTIGLAAWLMVLEALWLKTGKQIYADISRHWTKIFAVSFGMGVVSGVVMSYEFGTNWSELSRLGGNVIGPLLSYEVLTAFFLEAGFLGIMLFGRDRVPKWVHFFATCMVAAGTAISAFWILSANSWMQTPQGYRVAADGVLHVTDWWQVIFNPSFPYRFAHMVAAAYLTTAFVVSGIGAWYILKDKSAAHGRIMLGMGLSLIVWLAPLQLVIGDLHGLNAREHQPAKIAAVEAHWETRRDAPLVLFAWPDVKTESNLYEIAIPDLGSLVLTHEWDGEVRGLKSFPVEDRPDPVIPFFSFRIMVGIGFIMIALGFTGAVLWLMGRLYTSRWFLRAMALASPLGFIAVLAGWFVAEVGRQPWVVYGVLRTADAVSPVPGGSVLTSIILFVIVYGIVFGAGVYYMGQLVRRGPGQTPPVPEKDEADLSHRPMAAAGNP
ncbi:cytochrome D ubiquinol oxidase subunit I [Methyloceanibacter superfactus]|uniref:Cytochrome D ubiquinol oxidase subunit I n=1 Tax=Methyloceanibacter superfactus TaxID=1774969 RepID=A0A1E3VR41_9HYPH|nr:cytochrome ubiquinol oxidase subunit I [Methyloceanibacter superfactus]ODR96007.1 cytochrome D ubiquinol oxidase subunit I [Methyloceanibacter superfactus]